jgi:predicted TIM-barrel fold metal-dependent hydrolase
MKKTIAALFLMVGCAPATISFFGEAPNYTAVATSNRGKSTIYDCRETYSGEHRCSPREEGSTEQYEEPLPVVSAPEEETVQAIKMKLAQPDGCEVARASLEELRKQGAYADYYYFKGFCTSEYNPEKACDYYNRFLKVAKSDPRAQRAKLYVSSQSSADYPTCTLP